MKLVNFVITQSAVVSAIFKSECDRAFIVCDAFAFVGADKFGLYKMLRPLVGNSMHLKEVPMVPVEGNVFRVEHGGLTFYGNLMTFESTKDGSMTLKWRNHVFKRQP